MPKPILVLLIALVCFAACNTGDHKASDADSTTQTTTDTASLVKTGDSTAITGADSVLAKNARPQEPDPEADMPIDTSDEPLAALAADTGDIALDVLEPTPDAFTGCQVVVAMSEKKLSNGESIFVCTLGEAHALAAIRIKGVLVYLHGDTTQTALPNESYYTGHGYKLYLQQVILKSKWEDDESWNFKGTMEITRGRKKLKLRIYGTGGC